MNFLTGVLAAALLASPLLAEAGLFKWTDSSGKVHYGDRPPGDGSSVKAVKPEPTAVNGKEKNSSGKNVSSECGKVRYVQGFDPCNLPPGMVIIKGNGAEDDEARRELEASRRSR